MEITGSIREQKRIGKGKLETLLRRALGYAHLACFGDGFTDANEGLAPIEGCERFTERSQKLDVLRELAMAVEVGLDDQLRPVGQLIEITRVQDYRQLHLGAKVEGGR